MTKINTSSLPPITSINPSCQKQFNSLPKRKKKAIIDTDAIGTPTYNILLEFLRCQVKHPNTTFDAATGSDKKKECLKPEKMYSACHMAVMGVGNYEGKKHCGEEMLQLFQCVNPVDEE
ncbi:hypothetical protein ACHAWO_011715 [Cyclotella atomus]|jgi:hypothetical protein|uniref:Uncharacterized protein n=1 Tax=Cyclotella atomus TaxID=382360 RepID=A0ABD3P4M9_9STRA